MGGLDLGSEEARVRRTPDLGLSDGDTGCQQNGGGRTDSEAHLGQWVGGTETSWELGCGGGAVSGHEHTHSTQQVMEGGGGNQQYPRNDPGREWGVQTEPQKEMTGAR